MIELPDDANGRHRSIELWLHEFEFLMRAARGLQSREFFAAEVRRLLRRLGAVAADMPATNEILVRSGSEQKRLHIDGDHIERIGA